MNNAAHLVYPLLASFPAENERDLRNRRDKGVDPVVLNELAHELRQPLSAIESLAYYLELTSVDGQMCRHLEQIRHLVSRANGILDRAVDAP